MCWSYTKTKELLKKRVQKYIKLAYIEAETKLKRFSGDKKIDYALDYLSKKVLLLSVFKPLLREVLLETFSEHEKFINNMIIRTPIIL